MRVAVVVGILLVATAAQAEAPAAPPPAAQPSSPHYAPYPPPPPGYAYPTAPYQPAAELPYQEGAPIPVGYHVEERPRKGLVISGWVLSGVGYGLVLFGAVSSDFENESGWLAVPFAGPWLTLGRRDKSCDNHTNATTNEGDASGWECLGDAFLALALVMDGLVQAAGGTLLLVGYTNPKKHVVRDEAKLHIHPMQVFRGHGLGVTGTF